MEGRSAMEVHQAEAFLTVAEELHFGRAAQRLNMAQPPLSRLIKQLERTLGAQLFHRSTRHVSITHAGQALLGPAQELVRASEEAHRVVQNSVTGETGRVRIGFAGASINRSVGELARTLRGSHPGLKLEFYSSQFSHIGLERVQEGSLDLAIGRWDFVPAEIDSHVVALEEVLVALPASHPLASRTAVGMDQLASESWLTLPAGFGAALQNRMNSLARSAGFVPRVVQTAPDSWTLLVLVAAEMGCAVTLDSVRDNVSTADVAYVPIRGHNPPLEVRMIWRREDESPALKNVIKVSEKIFPGAPSASPEED